MVRVGLVDPGGARPVERSRLELFGLAKQRGDDLRLPELEGELGCGDQTPGALRGIAELRGATQRSCGHTDRSAAARAPTRLLELQGDVLVRSGDQCRAVPDPSVGLGLERFCERLVYTPSLLHARVLAYR